MEELRLWLPSVMMALALGWNIYLYLAAARKRELAALQADFDRVKSELADHKDQGARSRGELRDRLVHVEQQLNHMPTNDQYHRLEVGLTELRGVINTLAEALKPVAHTASRIEEWFLRQTEK